MKPLSILIVDDESPWRIFMQHFIQKCLDRPNIQFELAPHGEWGFQICEQFYRQRKTFDLVISDTNMPIMDGIELWHRLTALIPQPVPYVLLFGGLSGNHSMTISDVKGMGIPYVFTKDDAQAKLPPILKSLIKPMEC